MDNTEHFSPQFFSSTLFSLPSPSCYRPIYMLKVANANKGPPAGLHEGSVFVVPGQAVLCIFLRKPWLSTRPGQLAFTIACEIFAIIACMKLIFVKTKKFLWFPPTGKAEWVRNILRANVK